MSTRTDSALVIGRLLLKVGRGLPVSAEELQAAVAANACILQWDIAREAGLRRVRLKAPIREEERVQVLGLLSQYQRMHGTTTAKSAIPFIMRKTGMSRWRVRETLKENRAASE